MKIKKVNGAEVFVYCGCDPMDDEVLYTTDGIETDICELCRKPHMKKWRDDEKMAEA